MRTANQAANPKAENYYKMKGERERVCVWSKADELVLRRAGIIYVKIEFTTLKFKQPHLYKYVLHPPIMVSLH